MPSRDRKFKSIAQELLNTTEGIMALRREIIPKQSGLRE